MRNCAASGVQLFAFLFSSRRRHTRLVSDWNSDVCSSDLKQKRSEEHPSELQSLTNLVCRLLLGSEEHTSEIQSLNNLVCRPQIVNKNRTCLATNIRSPPL